MGLKILFSHLLAPVCSTCLSSHCSISLYPEHKCLSHYQINQPVVQLPPTSLSVLPLARQHNPLHSPTFPPVKESETQRICKNLCCFGLTAGGRDCCLLHHTSFTCFSLFTHLFLNSASLLGVWRIIPFSEHFQSSPHTGPAIWSYSRISYQSKGRMGLTARALEGTHFSVLKVKGKKPNSNVSI